MTAATTASFARMIANDGSPPPTPRRPASGAPDCDGARKTAPSQSSRLRVAQARTMTPPQTTDGEEAACAGRRTPRCPDAHAEDAGHASPELRTSSSHNDDEPDGLCVCSSGGDLSAGAASCMQVHGAPPEAPQHRQQSFTELHSEADGVVPAGVSSTETLRASSGPPLFASMRELRRWLQAFETAKSEPHEIADPKPVSRAREHQLRQAKSSVRGNRFYAHVAATRHSALAAETGTQASHDELLADVRSRQQHTPLQRERRAQKVRSDF